jgi:hypothetical protein
MQDVEPGSAMRTRTSGQLSGVTVTGRLPWRALLNPRRLRSTQEAARLLAIVRRPTTRRDGCPDRFCAISA